MVERRQYPRCEIALPTEVRTASGELLKTKAVNISHGGIELACDHPTALHIAPAPHRANPSGTPPVDISLGLPMADGSEPRLESHAAVVSVRRLCEQEYRFSLRFVELAEEFRDDLYRFLEQCIHPE